MERNKKETTAPLPPTHLWRHDVSRGDRFHNFLNSVTAAIATFSFLYPTSTVNVNDGIARADIDVCCGGNVIGIIVGRCLGLGNFAAVVLPKRKIKVRLFRPSIE